MIESRDDLRDEKYAVNNSHRKCSWCGECIEAGLWHYASTDTHNGLIRIHEECRTVLADSIKFNGTHMRGETRRRGDPDGTFRSVG